MIIVLKEIQVKKTRIFCGMLICVLSFFIGPWQLQAAVTPNDVYAVFDLADRKLNGILEAEGKPVFDGKLFPEKGLKPMHVYQMAVSCLETIHWYEAENGMVPVPIVIATPRKYTPADVLRLAGLVLFEVDRIAEHLKIYGLDEDAAWVENKTPTHVFFKILTLYIKMNTLAGKSKISPSEVYAQMVRAVKDVKSILGNIDPARRYRVDPPRSDRGLKPADVFKKCLSARESINASRRHFGLETIPVPALDPGMDIKPMDVFVQTQIIIAEINLLKMGTGTVSVTPLPISVTGKTPSDVHQQAALMKYLLGQIEPLEKLVAVMEKRK